MHKTSSGCLSLQKEAVGKCRQNDLGFVPRGQRQAKEMQTAGLHMRSCRPTFELTLACCLPRTHLRQVAQFTEPARLLLANRSESVNISISSFDPEAACAHGRAGFRTHNLVSPIVAARLTCGGKCRRPGLALRR